MSNKTKILIFLIIGGILLLGGWVYYKHVMPARLMDSGKKYLAAQQYDKALKVFRHMSNVRPRDIEPLYYEVLTLAKMAPTNEVQARLYEISQYDDCDEASNLADRVLANIRKQIYRQAGPSYIDNVLFEDSLVRWNNNRELTYSILADAPLSRNFDSIADRAFKEWQEASEGQFTFKKVSGKNADILVHTAYKLPEDNMYVTKDSAAVTIPNIKNDKLKNMDIYIKTLDKSGMRLPDNKVYPLLLHEIGHALGIGGHSANPNDIMYHDGDKVLQGAAKKSISRRDVNTLDLLYKMTPDVIDKELSESEKRNLIYHEVVTAYPGEDFEIETQRILAEIRRNGGNIVSWVDLAISYGLRRYYTRSNYILEKVLPMASSLEYNKFVVYYNMSLNFYRMKDYSSAARYLFAAEDIQQDKDTRVLGCFIDVRENRLAEAKRKLIDLKREYPKDIDISVKLAEVYSIEKNNKDRKSVIESLIKANPDAARDRRVIKYAK